MVRGLSLKVGYTVTDRDAGKCQMNSHILSTSATNFSLQIALK